MLELLLDHTTELDIPDSDGQTAAHIAAYNGEVKCLEILYDRGELDHPLFTGADPGLWEDTITPPSESMPA